MPLVLSGTDGVSGVDGTASNPSYEGTDSNTGIFYPAADTVAIGTGGTERLRVDSAGNAGLGVTPAAWDATLTGTRALQLGALGAYVLGTGSGWSSIPHVYVGNNGYWGSGSWRYTSSNLASQYYQFGGQHVWLNAASGTAGNAITFTQAMTLTASGQLELTAAAPRLAIAPSTGTNNAFVHFINSASANFSYVGIDSNGGGLGGQYTMNLWHGANYAMVFGTNNTERARITSDGAFCINTNAGTSGSSLAITGSGSTGATYNVYTRNSASNVVFATENGGVIYTGTLGGSPYNFTTASAANMFVTSSGVLQRSTSSGRFKTEVEDLEVGRADAILNLRPVWYRSICQSDNPDWSWYGLIAEDVAQVEPRLVHWGYESDDLETVEVEIEVEKERTVKDDDGNETVEAYTDTVLKPIQQPKEGAQLRPDGVQYDRMTVLLLDIVKRQQSRLEALEAEVQALKGNA